MIKYENQGKTMIKNRNKPSKNCYSCRKGIPQKYINKLGYTILRCPICSLVTLDFKENYQIFLQYYYQKEFFTGNNKIRAYSNYAQDKQNILKNARTILKKIKKIKNQGNLLDVGCAMGFFMEEAQQQGFSSFGIEVSKYAAGLAREKFKEKIFLGSVEDFFQKRNKLPLFRNLFFDVIVLSDFIEHVQDPRQVLQGLLSVLKNGGILIIQTGDIDSLWARLVGRNWHFFAPPQHLFYFSQKTLQEILSQAGYKIVRISKENKHVSISYILHLSQYMNIPKIGDLLFRSVSKTPFGGLSIPIKLYDNMLVIAKKNS